MLQRNHISCDVCRNEMHIKYICWYLEMAFHIFDNQKDWLGSAFIDTSIPMYYIQTSCDTFSWNLHLVYSNILWHLGMQSTRSSLQSNILWHLSWMYIPTFCDTLECNPHQVHSKYFVTVKWNSQQGHSHILWNFEMKSPLSTFKHNVTPWNEICIWYIHIFCDILK